MPAWKARVTVLTAILIALFLAALLARRNLRVGIGEALPVLSWREIDPVELFEGRR